MATEITALHVANTFLKRGFEEKVKITPMKLQKLIYILYKHYLKETGNTLFLERFGAWQKGPVIPTVYSEFKQYRWHPIDDFSRENDGTVKVVKLDTSPNFLRLFNDVWDKYKDVDAVKLSQLTHKSDGAWQKAIEDKSYILSDKNIELEPDYEI